MSGHYKHPESVSNLSVAEVAALIVGEECYIDTLRILLAGHLPCSVRKKLERALGRKLTYHKTKAEEVSRLYPFVTQISQPDEKLLKLLARVLPEHAISRLDVAMDLLTSSRKDAQLVR